MRLFNRACCAVHHQLCHPRPPISDGLPEQALEWPTVPLLSLWWWKSPCYIMFNVQGRGEGRSQVSSCVHAALNTRIAASYLFISSRQVFERQRSSSSSSSSDEMMMMMMMKHGVLRAVGKYQPQTGMQPLSNYQRPGSAACQSMETSVWLWIETNDSHDSRSTGVAWQSIRRRPSLKNQTLLRFTQSNTIRPHVSASVIHV